MKLSKSVAPFAINLEGRMIELIAVYYAIASTIMDKINFYFSGVLASIYKEDRGILIEEYSYIPYLLLTITLCFTCGERKT